VAPLDNGGAPVTDYVIEYRLAGSVTWLVLVDGISTGTTAVVTGLANGSEYEFTVTAVNVAGDGIPTSEATASPTAPASPTSEPIASITVPTLPTEAIEVEPFDSMTSLLTRMA
jgi:titin